MSFLSGLSGFGSWLGGLGSSIGNWANNNTAAAAIGSHLLGAGVVTDTLAAASAIGNKLSGGGGYSNLEKLAILNAVQEGNNKSTETKQTQADADASAAANTAAEQRFQQAKASETAARNAGLGNSRAASIGAGTSANTYANAFNSARNTMSSQSASTQADYMEKMGQGLALKNQADNLSKSARYAGISGALQGGSAGLSMGATISDENAKQDPSDPIPDDELNKAIEEFKVLKARVDELKGKCNE